MNEKLNLWDSWKRNATTIWMTKIFFFSLLACVPVLISKAKDITVYMVKDYVSAKDSMMVDSIRLEMNDKFVCLIDIMSRTWPEVKETIKSITEEKDKKNRAAKAYLKALE